MAIAKWKLDEVGWFKILPNTQTPKNDQRLIVLWSDPKIAKTCHTIRNEKILLPHFVSNKF